MFRVSEYTGPESIIAGLEAYLRVKNLSQNHHFKYLKDYFQTVTIKTIVFEHEYFDKDYLEDYSRYYSRCFQPYDKKCIRVHFFSHAFKEEDFVAIITDPTQKGIEDLQKNYAGFVVFRPIPHTIFGRTCLKTFPRQEKTKPEKNRQIPIVREYKVHLFGIELSVHSLAYQEQDNAVSACATSALWSAFQSTGISFHHSIPSPYEITLSAKELISSAISTNSSGNRGLDSKQMAYAVKAIGLDPLLLSPTHKDYLKAQIYAYLRGKIPVIMGLELSGTTEQPIENKQYSYNNNIGKHAITVTGYNLNNTLPDRCYTTPEIDDNKFPELYLRALKIDKFYVHDDQIGPFARIKFYDDASPEKRFYYLKTFFVEVGHKINNFTSIDAAPTVLLLPVNHKIRIDFHEIFSIVKTFNNVLTRPFRNITLEEYKDSIVVWDIHLSNVCDLKQYFSTCPDLSKENKKKLLTKSFPRYIWVV
ncbi:MAG: hypothetical protein LBF39_03250, partial [Prevotellaceae bacterium]|nr:hypothetical protein [Prevotellaceae bacterium]